MVSHMDFLYHPAHKVENVSPLRFFLNQMRNQPEVPWRRLRTMDEARAACRGCSEILFVKGPRERFDATSITRVVRDLDEAGPHFHEPSSDPSSLCAQYLQWLHPRIEFARPAGGDHIARIELWTNGLKLQLFEGSSLTSARRLAHQPAGDTYRKHRIQTRPQRRSSRCPNIKKLRS
jgi:hypothetical protein